MIAANPETAILLRSVPFSSMTRRTARERSASLLKENNSDNIMKARSGISSTQYQNPAFAVYRPGKKITSRQIVGEI